MNMRLVPFTISALLLRLWLKRMSRTALDMAAMQER
jgi:truncated hemoglobin YjbI